VPKFSKAFIIFITHFKTCPFFGDHAIYETLPSSPIAGHSVITHDIERTKPCFSLSASRYPSTRCLEKFKELE